MVAKRIRKSEFLQWKGSTSYSVLATKDITYKYIVVEKKVEENV